jgi:hypothetical protein
MGRSAQCRGCRGAVGLCDGWRAEVAPPEFRRDFIEWRRIVIARSSLAKAPRHTRMRSSPPALASAAGRAAQPLPQYPPCQHCRLADGNRFSNPSASVIVIVCGAGRQSGSPYPLASPWCARSKAATELPIEWIPSAITVAIEVWSWVSIVGSVIGVATVIGGAITVTIVWHPPSRLVPRIARNVDITGLSAIV